jgi:hypothetical protein
MLLLLVTANDDDLPLSLENIDESNIEVEVVVVWWLSCLAVKANDDDVHAEAAVLAPDVAPDALKMG